MARFILVALLCISLASLAFCGDKWSYDTEAADGPAHWGGDCKTGKRQSPIDIKTDDETYDSGLVEFSLKNYDKKLDLNFTASNNGHALKVAFPEKKYTVTGGGLDTPLFSYTTIQLHLHWGSNNSKGSEHTMNGKSYAAEMHFVSYHTKYTNVSVALSKSDGLAVLGVFIEVEGNDNPAFSFLEIASKLQNGSKDTKEVIPAFKFADLLPSNKSKYHRYDGSLTTPTCNEAVIWTVFNDPIKMSQRQMNLLRSLKKEDFDPIVDNFRPVQPLNNRKVKASFHVPKTTKTTEGPTVKATEAGASAVISLFFVNVVCLAFIALF